MSRGAKAKRGETERTRRAVGARLDHTAVADGPSAMQALQQEAHW